MVSDPLDILVAAAGFARSFDADNNGSSELRAAECVLVENVVLLEASRPALRNWCTACRWLCGGGVDRVDDHGRGGRLTSDGRGGSSN